MTLLKLWNYLDRIRFSSASQNTMSELNKEFVIRDTRTGINYPVKVIDEGMNPAELSIETLPDSHVSYEGDSN